MNFDLNNVIRSAAVVVVGLPVSVAVSVGVISSLPSETVVDRETSQLKAKLTVPCIEWGYSKPDSKLERQAKNTIDDYFGGEVNHAGVCKYVLG